MPFEQAKKQLLNALSTITETEIIDIAHADSRVLAQDIHSNIMVPGHNNSAMDGYALRDDALASGGSNPLNEFTIIGSAYAGKPFNGELSQGQCIRIMTGAVVPNSANSVIMQEQVSAIESEVGKTIRLLQPASVNSHIRFAGEDIQQGQTIFHTGYQLKAVDLGLLASLGVAQVEVLRKLKVAVCSNGDELTLPGQPLKAGDIYESNSQVLEAMLKRVGVEVLSMGIIADDPVELEQAFIQASKQADALICSGGVSVGDADHIKQVLQQLGKVEFWQVAIKPGKPFAFGHLGNCAFFGLPGNPVSAAVTFHQLALPALAAMSGTTEKPRKQLTAITNSAIKKRHSRMDFQRGVASLNEQGQLTVTPLAAQGSGILSSLSKANCYLILGQDNRGHNAGDAVKIELFDHIIG